MGSSEWLLECARFVFLISSRNLSQPFELFACMLKLHVIFSTFLASLTFISPARI